MISLLFTALLLAGGETPVPPANAACAQGSRQLLTIHRVMVDRLTGGETAAQMRDMIIASLQNAGLFVVTENAERADAVLRGSAEDLVYTEQHSYSENANIRSTGSSTKSSRSSIGSGGIGAGLNENSRDTERRHEANAAVRLVNKDGDVIWSTTQESMGGKFRGASADVADKITRKLIDDFERARTGKLR